MNDKPLITDLIRTRRVYIDGAMGTMLHRRGLEPGQPSEMWNISHPDAVTDIHLQYLAAGCDIITANTFGANGIRYDDPEPLLRAGMACARKAADKYPGSYVALDIGPSGRLLEPLGDLAFEDAVRGFGVCARTAQECGADLIIIETMNDCYETKAALLAVKENCSLPVFVMNVYDESGKLMTGADAWAMVCMLEGMGADVIGMNCSLGPDKMLPVARQMLSHASVPVVAVPNAGLPHVRDGQTVYDMDEQSFCLYAEQLARAGVSVLGGCCGTDPNYIKLLVEKTRDIPLPDILPKNETVVSSYTHACLIGASPVLIGERINPTGKPAFKKALRDSDMDYVLAEGIRQADAGVQVLDVNVGLPEIDERAVLCECIGRLQAVTDLPLQIDTSSSEALGAAMRIYNGKPLVNSVNGKEEVMSAVFPLVRKYGGAVIALTLDESGIPSSAEQRVAIAEKIIDRAAEYGIRPCDIIVDPLAMAVSSDPNGALVTLRTVQLLHERGIRTSLGVSNISFGLPCRDKINSTFFAEALAGGLDCAIINPFSSPMMDTYYAFRALHALDTACAGYIAYASDAACDSAPSSVGDMTLRDCIEKGLSADAAAKTAELLKSVSPEDIINLHISAALNKVGDDFEHKRAYLPQLLMSADAATASFAEVKKALPPSEDTGRRMILATVHGDIHDIGKNIVRVMLESYGFGVIDLGRDVPPEKVLQAVQRSGCRLVGLSALMTTTVPAMERTIKLLHEFDPDIKVAVGGAVLNREYADMIHADVYCADAMDTVRYAEAYYAGI